MAIRAAIALALLTSTAAIMSGARGAEPAIVRKAFDQFPMTLSEWHAVQDPPMDPQVLKVLGVDDYLSRAYYRPGGDGVGLYMGFYTSQRQGDTIHSPLNCLPGAGWEPLSQGRLRIDGVGADGGGIDVNRYVVQKGLERQMVLYWYQSHGRVIASEYVSRLWLIHDAIRLNRTDGSLVRVIAPIRIGEDDSRAERLAEEFVRVLYPTLGGYLPS